MNDATTRCESVSGVETIGSLRGLIVDCLLATAFEFVSVRAWDVTGEVLGWCVTTGEGDYRISEKHR